jgi:hypothetical protein
MVEVLVCEYQLRTKKDLLTLHKGFPLMLVLLTEDDARHLLNFIQIHIVHTQSRVAFACRQINEQGIFGYLGASFVVIRSIQMAGKCGIPWGKSVAAEDVVDELE